MRATTMWSFKVISDTIDMNDMIMMQMEETVPVNYGGVQKMLIEWHYSGDSQLSLSQCANVRVTFWCAAPQVFAYSDLKEQDGNLYAFVDTRITGRGRMSMKVECDVPDELYGWKPDVCVAPTNVTVR